MTSRYRSRVGVLAVAGALALLAGCGTGTEAGEGAPAGGAGGDAGSSRPQLPPRPQEVDLTGITASRVCGLLTVAQQAELGFDREPSSNNAGDRYGNPRCDYARIQSEPRYGYRLGPVTQEDVTVYLDGTRNATARVVEAAGFPAIEYRIPGDEQACFVGVSTMDGQYLTVQYDKPIRSDQPVEVTCEAARVAAEMAMTTLLAQQG